MTLVNKKISELPTGSLLQETDLIGIARAGANFYITGTMISDYIDANWGGTALNDIAVLQEEVSLLQENSINKDGTITMQGNLEMGSYPVVSSFVATADTHLVNKKYIDDNIPYLSGATYTGDVILNADPTAALQAATKQYVDTEISSVSSLTIDTNDLLEGTDGSATGTGTETDNNKYFYTVARWDTRWGTKNTDTLTEGSTNQYFTTSRFDSNFISKTTDSLPEGSTNFYYTDSKVRLALSAVSPIIYNDTTGEISITPYYLPFTGGVLTGNLGMNSVELSFGTNNIITGSTGNPLTLDSKDTVSLTVENGSLNVKDTYVSHVFSAGTVTIYGTKIESTLGGYTSSLIFPSPSSARQWTMPDATGTVALTSDFELYKGALSAAPSSPANGEMYYNTSDSHFYGWNSTAWKQLDN